MITKIMISVSLSFRYRTELVNAANNDKRTPLHYACYAKRKGLVQKLLKAGAYPYARYYIAYA